MTTRSQLYRLVEERLDCSLVEFAAQRWPQQGWRKIAAEIKEQTGIEVSHTALRLWLADQIVVESRTLVRGDTSASANSAA